MGQEGRDILENIGNQLSNKNIQGVRLPGLESDFQTRLAQLLPFFRHNFPRQQQDVSISAFCFHQLPSDSRWLLTHRGLGTRFPRTHDPFGQHHL